MDNQSELDWNTEDVMNLRTFLATRTGQKLIPKIAEATPPLMGGGDVNAILIRNGVFQGFQGALKELFSLANPPPAPAKPIDPYPSLTDDSQWDDKQKIEPVN